MSEGGEVWYVRLCCVAAVAVVIRRVGLNNVTVAVDGSLYRFHPHFKQLMTNKITQLLPEHMQVSSNDRTGQGNTGDRQHRRPIWIEGASMYPRPLSC